MHAYLAALQADPSLNAAYKALGTVYYMAGDRRGALYYYGRYLSLNPDDAPTRDFADRLRASLGIAAPAQASEAQHPDGPFRPGFDVRLPFAGVAAGAADMDEFYDNYSAPPASTGLTQSDNVPQANLGWASGLGLDYGWSNGFVEGLDLLYGPVRNYTVTNALDGAGQNIYTETDTIGVNEFSVMLTPGWRFRLGRSMVLEPRLGLGWMDSTMVQGTNLAFSPYGQGILAGDPVILNAAGTYTATSAGSGYAVWPEVRGEYLFGQFGVGLSLGYLLTTPAPQTYTSVSNNMSNLAAISSSPPPAPGAAVGYQSSPTATSLTKWHLETDGFTFGLFVTYHFQPLFW